MTPSWRSRRWTNSRPAIHGFELRERRDAVDTRKRLLLHVLLACVLLPLLNPAGSLRAYAQDSPSPREKAETLLASLTPEERVGQLFLVNFRGTDLSPESEIYDLITRFHIGGVILRADHDNFNGPENVLDNTVDLVQSLQQTEWNATQGTITETQTGELLQPVFIPLLVGISQPGDGAPYDQIRGGLTKLPSSMAVGATWNPDLARQAGLVSGAELSALGINLLLGPSLDVLETPNPESGGDLGVQTFGGDPFWVAQMGSAYIAGIHEGSANRIAVFGTHFPGVGGADRPLEEEVSTVRKSLEQLKQIELAPFFFITGDAPNSQAAADGLLISHIRYQGFLGNIRATTRPISFDEASFAEIISLPQFSDWRAEGGIMVTDDLGSRAVRRFYDPGGQSFNARLVVRDAFLAGNDLLYLGDILDTGDERTYNTVQRIMQFFRQRYQEDQTFARRVDESVLRILTLKYRLNENFSLQEALPNFADVEPIGNQQDVSLEIARQGATLISPDLSTLDTVLPDAPGIGDRVIFITDTGSFQQCSDCVEEKQIPIDAFQQAVLRLYGPEAGDQVDPSNLLSFSFENLLNMLNGESATSIESNLRNAAWVVVAMREVNPTRPESQALRRLLAERDDLIRNKRIVVFAFNKPYLLDATDISKLTAYYALYSKNPAAIDSAARILFKEFVPTFGALPVSVPGIGYDLISATSPDPSQTLQIFLDEPDFELDAGQTSTPDPGAIAQVALGEQISLRTSLILDHNGNPVPNGTPVQFTINLNGLETLSSSVTTVDGIARLIYLVNEPGTIQIGLITEPMATVTPFEIIVPIPEGLATPLVPTETPTQDPTPLPSPTPTEAPEVAPEVTSPPRTQTDLVDWGLGFLASLFVGLAAYRVGIGTGRVRWSLRWGLASILGGLLAYTYLSLDLPGSLGIIQSGRGGVLWVSLAGAGAGWAIGLVWQRLTAGNGKQTTAEPAEVAETRSR